MLRAAKVLASVASCKGSCECCEQQRFLRVLPAAKVLAIVYEQQRFLRVYASCKASCACIRAAKVLASVYEQQKFLRVLRAVKVLASFASSKGSCECCEQQRFL